MRLLKFELFKLINNRIFLILITASALLNFAFLNYQSYMQKNTDIPYESYRLLIEELKDKTHEEKGKLIHQAYERAYAIQMIYQIQNHLKSDSEALQAYGKSLRKENQALYNKYYKEANNQPSFPYTKDCYKEYSLLEQIKNDYDKIDHYQQAIQDILAEGNDLQGISIFNQKNSISQKSIKAIDNAYRQMLNTVVDYQIDKGMEAVTAVSISDFLIILLIMSAIMLLVYEEKDKRLCMLIRSTVNGYMMSITAKLAALMITIIAIALLFYGMNFMFYYFTIGYGNFNATIQSLPMLMLSTLKLNSAAYLLLFFLSKLLTLCLFSIIVFYFAIRLPSSGECMLLTAVMLCISLLFYRLIPLDSPISAFGSFNFITLLNTNELYATYTQLRLFDFMFDKHIMLITLQLITIFLFTSLSIYHYLSTMSIVGKEKRIIDKISRHYTVHLKIHRLFHFELYKLLIVNRALLIIIVYALFLCFHYNQLNDRLSFDEGFYKGYMEALSGELNMEKEQMIKDVMKEYEKAEKALLEIDALVNEKKLTYAEASIAKIPHEDILATQVQFDRIVTKYEYVKAHKHAEFVYDSGYIKLFGIQNKINENDIIFIIMTMLIVIPVFINEYKTGFIQLLNTTQKGRKETAVHKISATVLVCSIMFGCYLSAQLALCNRMFGFQELSASITSLEYFTDLPYQISILGYLIAYYTIKYLSYLLIILLIQWLSVRLKQTAAVFILSLLVLILPYAISYYGIEIIPLFPLLNLSWLLHHGITIITIVAIVFLCLFLYNNLLKRREYTYE